MADIATSIQVAVRCRPMSSRETNRGATSTVTVEGRTITVEAEEGRDDHHFTYDHAYGAGSTQEQVYNDLGEPVVSRALEGYNGTIFAYGQTGSGKTHTMMGDDSGNEVGIVPRLTEELFRRIQAGTSSSSKFMCTVSYLEIYNEEVKDLLNPSDRVMALREHPDLGVYVQDLCELVVTESTEVLRLLEQGNTVRRVASTNMNERSSRSHTCFTIKIEHKSTETLGDVTKETSLSAKLNLVDLAGSERAKRTGATGQTLREGAKINQSLMTLGRVIKHLSEGTSGHSGHIPYRDSKLTRLLQESLGGNALTVMIAAISPANDNYEETLSTLRYANRAKSIENAVVRNEDVNEKIIRELKDEIEKLREQLLQGGAGGVGGGSAETDEELQKRLQEMRQVQEQTWEEKEKLSKALAEQRNENMNNAIEDVMASVKEEKISHMKRIKRLQHERQTLGKKLKALKEKRDGYKTQMDEEVAHYNEVEATFNKIGKEHEKAGELEREMEASVQRIEALQAKLKEAQNLMKVVRARTAEIEETITDEQGDFMANKMLLQENERIKAAIREEERAKLEEERKEILARELHDERQRLEQKEEESAAARAEMEDQLRAQAATIAELTARIAVLEQDNKRLDQEKQDVQAELEQTIEQQAEEQVELESKLDNTEKELESLRIVQAEAEQLQQALEDAEALREDEREQHAAQIEELNRVHQNELQNLRTSVAGSSEEILKAEEDTEYRLVASLMDGFEKERRRMAKQYKEAQALLQNATRDLMYLATENKSLREATLGVGVRGTPIGKRTGTADVVA